MEPRHDPQKIRMPMQVNVVRVGKWHFIPVFVQHVEVFLEGHRFAVLDQVASIEVEANLMDTASAKKEKKASERKDSRAKCESYCSTL